MSLLDRYRLWRVSRQMQRCKRGYHHYKSLSIDRMRCVDPGCGKWYGQ